MEKNKKKKKHIGLKILLSVFVTLGAAYGIFAITNAAISNDLVKYAKSFDKIQYENQIEPYLDSENNYTFKTDRDFKIVQLTDIHLGCGFLSKKKDKMALNAIASMLTYEKPDLVVITGDVAFPVPYIAGTINNANQPKVLLSLLEKLGVYWTLTFGNHDTEAYAYKNRDKVSKIYGNEKYKYCLFSDNYKSVSGKGNQIITIRNSSDYITQSLFIIDSHSYLGDDPFGIKWHYDNVHEDQINWYKNKVNELTNYNKSIDASSSTVSSLVFQHIPLEEYSIAYHEYVDNGNQNTADSIYNFGTMGEDPKGKHVYCPDRSDNFFETMLEVGSTKGMFVGHDHLNNFSFTYKGIDLNYGMSIDYLAYDHIEKYGSQRGCSVIESKLDSSYTLTQENYYQEKYASKYPKEKVTMEPCY